MSATASSSPPRRVCSCPRCVTLRRQVAAARVLAAHSSPAYATLIEKSSTILSSHESALNSDWDVSNASMACFPVPFQRFLLTGELPPLPTPAHTPIPASFAPIFIVGCGRSGTSLLSSFFARNGSVLDLNEARALWLHSCPSLDIWSVASHARGSVLVPSPDLIHDAAPRLRAAFHAHVTSQRGAAQLVEKSPENAFRLQLLTRAFPGCTLLHMTRSESRVAASIAAFSPDVWYGPTDAKWTALSQHVAEYLNQSDETAVARVAGVCARLGDMRARGRVERFAAVACARVTARQLGLSGVIPDPPPVTDLPAEVLEVLGPSRPPVVERQGEGDDAVGRYMEVAFEELVMDPRDTWRRIADFCRLPRDAEGDMEALYATLNRDRV